MTIQDIQEEYIIKKHLFTREDYHKMAAIGILKPTDQVELINGEIITMSPIKSPHASIVSHLTSLINHTLFGKAYVSPQNPIQMSNISEPEPDVVVAKYREDQYFHGHPKPEEVHIIIEVADTTLHYDRNTKAPLYAEAGIPEYWIVNIKAQEIEVRTNIQNGIYQNLIILKKGDTLTAMAIPFSINLNDVFF